MTATGVEPPGLGARTWRAAGPGGSPASPRSQLAAAVVVASAFAMVAVPLPSAVPWVIALVVAFVVAIVVAVVVAAEPIALFDKVSGVVVALVVAVSSLVGIGVIAAFTGDLIIPFGVVPVAAAFALGLDWRRVERLQVVLTLAGAVVLVSSLGEPGWTYLVAAVWVAAAFGTYALLEGDRRAALPRVQPEARGAAAAPAGTDLATSLLIALGVGLVAALVLSVPACERRMQDRSGQGSGRGAGDGGGSGGSESFDQSHRYAPDPDGRFLVPNDGRPSYDREGRPIPTPETTPSLGEGERTVERLADGSVRTTRGLPGGDVEVTTERPDGTVERWRLHERSDGLTQIDELDDEGEVVDSWYFDPEGQIAEGDGSGGQSSVPSDELDDRGERAKPSWGTLLKVVGLLVLVGAAIAGGAWWWSRRRGSAPPVGPAPPPWAIALAQRMEDEGSARGRARAPGESMVAFGRELVGGALPDERLGPVAEAVSDALFSGRDPGPEVQAWAESTFATVIAAHPVPSKRDRRAAASSA